MFEKNFKTKTNIGLAVTFAVLMGACTSKHIKMEASEMALDVPETEQVEVGDATVAANNDGTMFVAEDTYKASKTVSAKKSKRKGSKSHSLAKKSKKSHKALALNKQPQQQPQVSAAATVAKEIETPKTFDQELAQYPSNDTLNNIVVPAPMEEAAMVDESSSTGFWMYVLAGLMITLGAAGYVYKIRFAKAGNKGRKLVYRA